MIKNFLLNRSSELIILLSFDEIETGTSHIFIVPILCPSENYEAILTFTKENLHKFTSLEQPNGVNLRM